MKLLGDIGGTNFRLALFQDNKITRQQVYSTTAYPKMEDAIKDFIQSDKPVSCCLAIAGPVTKYEGYQTVSLTNQQHDEYNSAELAKILGFPCKFINDFEAVGYYLMGVTDNSDPTKF